MDWISVKDRLPDEDPQDEGFSNEVIVTDGYRIGIGYYEFEYFSKDPAEEVQYSSACWHNNDSFFGNVTHWMSKPKLPKESHGS